MLAAKMTLVMRVSAQKRAPFTPHDGAVAARGRLRRAGKGNARTRKGGKASVRARRARGARGRRRGSALGLAAHRSQDGGE
eukprot:IDg5855t1